MVTFGAWLEAQKNRQDAIGELARYWLNLKGGARIRALPSVENKLREAGALDPGAPTLAWWEEVTAAWRAYRNTPTTISGRPLASVPDAPSQPTDAPLLTGSSHEDLNRMMRAAGEPPYGSAEDRIQATLDSHTRYLAAIAVKLGLSATMVAELAAAAGMQPPQPVLPIDWAGRFEQVDWDQVEGGGAQ